MVGLRQAKMRTIRSVIATNATTIKPTRAPTTSASQYNFHGAERKLWNVSRRERRRPSWRTFSLRNIDGLDSCTRRRSVR